MEHVAYALCVCQILCASQWHVAICGEWRLTDVWNTAAGARKVPVNLQAFCMVGQEWIENHHSL